MGWGEDQNEEPPTARGVALSGAAALLAAMLLIGAMLVMIWLVSAVGLTQ